MKIDVASGLIKIELFSLLQSSSLLLQKREEAKDENLRFAREGSPEGDPTSNLEEEEAKSLFDLGVTRTPVSGESILTTSRRSNHLNYKVALFNVI